MTRNATEFITAVTFETLTGNKALVDTLTGTSSSRWSTWRWRTRRTWVLVAPATANVIAKLAHGMADDMLTTHGAGLQLSQDRGPRHEYKDVRNPVTQDNLNTPRAGTAGRSWSRQRLPGLRRDGKEESCRAQELLQTVLTTWLEGFKPARVVTAGHLENLDPVRYLTNRSSGKWATPRP